MGSPTHKTGPMPLHTRRTGAWWAWGLGLASAPAYPGADFQRHTGAPLLEYRWSNGVFAGGDGLLGCQITPRPGVQVGLLMAMDPGRKENAAAALVGMGNVDATATAGGYARMNLGEQLQFSTSVQAGSGNDRTGALFSAGMTYALALPLPVQTRLVASVSAGNSAYMQGYFGVNALQAARSAYTAYAPSAGMRDASLGVEWMYPLAPRWVLMGSVKQVSLLWPAKDSPLVHKATSTTTLVGLVYML